MPGIAFTGYSRFPGVPDNPSQALIEALAGAPEAVAGGHSFHLLATEYERLAEHIDGILAERPAALVMTGFSAAARGFQLECAASDYCSPDYADAAGRAPAEQGREVRRLTSGSIDFEALCGRISAAGLPCEISRDAGRYVCNAGYFAALSRIAGRGPAIPAIFVHVPAIADTALAARSAASMPLADMMRAMGIVADFLVS